MKVENIFFSCICLFIFLGAKNFINIINEPHVTYYNNKKNMCRNPFKFMVYHDL